MQFFLLSAIVSSAFAALPSGLKLSVPNNAIVLTSYQATVPVQLSAAPGEDVTVVFEVPSQYSLDKCSLTFKAAEWNKAQNVVVSLSTSLSAKGVPENLGNLVYSFMGCGSLKLTIPVASQFDAGASCSSTNDPHVSTFDKKAVEAHIIQPAIDAGKGSMYVMKSSRLSVQAKQQPFGSGGASINVEVTISYLGQSVVVQNVNSAIKMTSYGAASLINGAHEGNKYTFKTTDNTVIVVELNFANNIGYMNIYINVDGFYKNMVSGVCGNFNGIKDDDCSSVIECNATVPQQEEIAKKYDALYSSQVPAIDCKLPTDMQCPTTTTATTFQVTSTAKSSIKSVTPTMTTSQDSPYAPPKTSILPLPSTTSKASTSTTGASNVAGSSVPPKTTILSTTQQESPSNPTSKSSTTNVPYVSSSPSSPSVITSVPAQSEPTPCDQAPPVQLPSYGRLRKRQQVGCAEALSSLTCCADTGMNIADLINFCDMEMVSGTGLFSSDIPLVYANSYKSACNAAIAKNPAGCLSAASADAGRNMEFKPLVNTTDAASDSSDATFVTAQTSVSLQVGFTLVALLLTLL